MREEIVICPPFKEHFVSNPLESVFFLACSRAQKWSLKKNNLPKQLNNGNCESRSERMTCYQCKSQTRLLFPIMLLKGTHTSFCSLEDVTIMHTLEQLTCENMAYVVWHDSIFIVLQHFVSSCCILLACGGSDAINGLFP